MSSYVDGLKSAEARFHDIDRQFISGGLRLVLVLPATALIFLFGAWGYSSGSPTFWKDNIEPSIGLDFSTFLKLISATILLGFCASLYLHRKRMTLTKKVFRAEVRAASDAHRPVTSMHGFPSLESLIFRTMASHNTALWLAVISIITVIGSAWLPIDSELGMRGLLASSALVTLAIGQHMTTRGRDFHMVQHNGLLDAYYPPIHPSTLDQVFNDMLSTHMDPILRSRFDDFLLELDGHLRPEVSKEHGREKFLMVMHLRRKGSLDRSEVQLELEEILVDEGVMSLQDHEVFKVEIWDSLFERAEVSCPAFFRLINRIEQDVSIGIQPEMDELVFDVDIESVVHDKANLFCYLHNMSDQEKHVVLRVQSPDFRPNDLSLRYRLAPSSRNWWPDEITPVSSEGDDDQLGRMAGILREGTIAWQTLLPERIGDASVAIRLEEVSGDLLVGRQINVNIRHEFIKRLRNTAAFSCNLLGGFGLITSIILQAISVLSVA